LIPRLVGLARRGKQRDGQALEVGEKMGKRIIVGVGEGTGLRQCLAPE